MTLASWHRGESWNPGTREGGGAGLSQEFPSGQSPLQSLTAQSLSSHPVSTSHGPPCGLTAPPPAPLTALRVWGRLLGGRRDFLHEPGRTSSSCRGNTRDMETAKNRVSRGLRPSPSRPQTKARTGRPRDHANRAAEQLGQAGGPGLEARRGGGRRASWEGPRGRGRGRHSRRPPRPAARPPAAPGSGGCRGTARGSADGSARPGRPSGPGPRGGGARTTAGGAGGS